MIYSEQETLLLNEIDKLKKERAEFKASLIKTRETSAEAMSNLIEAFKMMKQYADELRNQLDREREDSYNLKNELAKLKDLQ